MSVKRLYWIAKPIISKVPFLKKAIFYWALRCEALPKVLTIALTYRCQCDCTHCGVSDYRRGAASELSTQEVKAIVDNAAHIPSIVQVTFTGGEVLLRDDLLGLIRYSKAHKLFTKFDSNGELLTEAKIKELVAAGVDRIDISIDHHQSQVHDAFRKRVGLFDKVVKAVRLCQKYQIPCYLQTYVTRINLCNGDLERILAFARDVPVGRIKIQPPAIVGMWSHSSELSLQDQDFRMLEQLLSRYPFAYLESELFPAAEHSLMCKVGLKGNVYITSYGDVYPCCYLPISFGNIRQESLGAIMRSMYKSDTFKNLQSLQGCLCSNEEVQRKFACKSNVMSVSR